MSRSGHCHDNAVAESFFNLLKRERIRRRTYRSREEARQGLFDYIEMVYNPIRKLARNDMLSPVEFERRQDMMGGWAQFRGCELFRLLPPLRPQPGSLSYGHPARCIWLTLHLVFPHS